VLKGHLHVGGQVVPGRFWAVTAAGKAWVALPRQGSAVWGVGTTAHALRRGAEARLSADGRYLVVSSGSEACLGYDARRSTCVVRLLDATGKVAPRRLTIRRTMGRPGTAMQVEVLGVTDQGAVVLNRFADHSWDDLVWDAAGGAHGTQPLTYLPPSRDWAVQGWEQGGFGPAGFEFSTGSGPERWLGEIVDGQLRPRVRLPENTTPGPGARWVLGTAWQQTRPGSASGPRTTRVLRAWRPQRRGKPVRLRAPHGWSFAQDTGPSPVSWESADAFLALLVDARQGGDRLARCDIPLATCVTLAD
jgi:hypothetical protein